MPDQPVQYVQYQLIGSDGIEYGPVSAEEVRQWITESRASAKTMVKASNNPAWRRLGELPEFAEAIALRAANARAASPAGTPVAVQPEQNKTARVGFILSLVSLLCCCAPLAPVGTITSMVSLLRINSGKDPAEGYGFALAGIIIGIMVMIINLVVFIYFPDFLPNLGSKKVFGQ